MNLQNRKGSTATTILFIIYLTGLFCIIVLKLTLPTQLGHIKSINLLPYKRPLAVNGEVGITEMILNVLIFVPLGIYTAALYKSWPVVKQCLFFLLVSLTCEVSEYLLRIGIADITDVINNTIGGIIGLLVFKGIEKIFGDSVKAQKCINIIATIGTIAVIALLLLLKINNLWIFRR